MRPVAIPDHLVTADSVRRTFAAPAGLEEHVAPCEALITRGADGLAEVSVPVELDEHERAQLLAGVPIWLTMLGGLSPFRLSTTPPGDD